MSRGFHIHSHVRATETAAIKITVTHTCKCFLVSYEVKEMKRAKNDGGPPRNGCFSSPDHVTVFPKRNTKKQASSHFAIFLSYLSTCCLNILRVFEMK